MRKERGRGKTASRHRRGRDRERRLGAVDAARRARSATSEYAEFYQHVAHDFEDPLALDVHNRVEGTHEYTHAAVRAGARAVRPVGPRRPPRAQALRAARVHHGRRASSSCRRTCASCAAWSTSNDLPLNVSREILQARRATSSAIRARCAKRILGLLEDLAEDEQDKYATFWSTFGTVLKEGVGRGRRQPRADREAAALRLHAHRRGHAGRGARRLRRAHAAAGRRRSGT